MGSTIWKGALHFGEESIPVKLHGAVKEERISFHLLHRQDQVRLQQQMVCAAEKVPVPAEAQVRGFQVEEGKYLLVTAEELDRIVPESNRLIEVHEFVSSSAIDPFFFDHPYHLEADDSLEPAGYGALAELLQETGLTGICTWVMRKRAYHGALQSLGGTLRLTTLRYADELVSLASLGLEEMPLAEKELQIGSELIRQLTAPFEPSKYVNEHRQKLQELLDRKARGEMVTLLRPRMLEPTAADRLLEVLEASLKKAA